MVKNGLTTFNGIVIYQQEYKERDLLVKILTREFGKKMFFVKNGKSRKSRLAAELQPLMQATYEGTINYNGLSFIDDVKESRMSCSFIEDIELNAYGTYILGLVDSAFMDNKPLLKFFDLVKIGLEKIDDGFDPQGIANYFELTLLPYFGLDIIWNKCVICGRSDLPLDFSDQYNGVICKNHFQVDEKRWHIDIRAMLVFSKFYQISLKQLGSLKLKSKTKIEMNRLMDHIYDDQVGIHLKSKSFIQQLENW